MRCLQTCCWPVLILFLFAIRREARAQDASTTCAARDVISAIQLLQQRFNKERERMEQARDVARVLMRNPSLR